MQGWILQQKQERRLLRVRESGPGRRAFRVQEQTLLRAQARKPLRHQDRARVGVQAQYQKETPFRLDERVPRRYQVMGQERRLLLRPEPLLFSVPCRPQERGPH